MVEQHNGDANEDTPCYPLGNSKRVVATIPIHCSFQWWWAVPTSGFDDTLSHLCQCHWACSCRTEERLWAFDSCAVKSRSALDSERAHELNHFYRTEKEGTVGSTTLDPTGNQSLRTDSSCVCSPSCHPKASLIWSTTLSVDFVRSYRSMALHTGFVAADPGAQRDLEVRAT